MCSSCLKGSLQKFKKLCEKLQSILLSHDRSPEKTRYSRGSVGGNAVDGKTKKDELRPKIIETHVISDTESEGELLSLNKEDKHKEAKTQT
jgi:hypothetical protein